VIDGGEVGFTPENPPAVTEALLDHIIEGKPKKGGWNGGHAFGAGKGKSEFPESWDRAESSGCHRLGVASAERN
jgi:hypothetical protein